ncbi:MAG: tRNA (adenosine(37)-N6)-threonylcarbamoyltransferase complex dimerization subunit type 1 TsaB [Elusimicrobia bacterium CG1_02_63_36]|nr:MAG: tRNA (adenosine(37)-N6)-threonylcarbamoyltransferase complex dimerization subunit type 1 TsaB [Elusimicrobia bacterium CG1_02_63_36]
MKLLAIECLGDGVSVAVSTKPGKVYQRKVKAKRQDEKLVSTLDGALKAARTRLDGIDAIVVASGPGRFTSARIGVTFANTLAWSLGKPIAAVTLFDAFAERLSAEGIADGDYALAFPAVREEWYVQDFRWTNGVCSARGDPRWVESARGVRTPARPIEARDLLPVAARRMAEGTPPFAEAVPLYLKPASYLKK